MWFVRGASIVPPGPTAVAGTGVGAAELGVGRTLAVALAVASGLADGTTALDACGLGAIEGRASPPPSPTATRLAVTASAAAASHVAGRRTRRIGRVAGSASGNASTRTRSVAGAASVAGLCS